MGETIVFDGKMGMRKFGSAAPPFGKVACVVKGILWHSISHISAERLQRFNGSTERITILTP